MKKLWIMLFALGLILGCQGKRTEPIISHTPESLLPVSDPNYKTAYSASYYSGSPEEAELEGLQCPIPMKDRVRNHTGSQCVFSSIEMLGRWAECKELVDPPITSRSNCKGGSGPDDAGRKLKDLGVRFEQTTNRTEGIAMIKKAMAEHRGCLWGVPGHAMVIVHYDEEKDVVKWVDNSDRSLRVQTTNIKGFNQRWQGWIMVIYANPDIVEYKVAGLANEIPIIDHNNPQGKYPKNYIPLPGWWPK